MEGSCLLLILLSNKRSYFYEVLYRMNWVEQKSYNTFFIIRVASTGSYHKVLFSVLPYEINAFYRMTLCNITFCNDRNVLYLHCLRQ